MGRSLRDALLEEADSSARQPPQQSDSSTEGGASPTTPRRAPKGPLEDTPQPQNKRQKWDTSETLEGSETESGTYLILILQSWLRRILCDLQISGDIPLYQGDV